MKNKDSAKTKIELNGTSQRLELLMLIFMTPVWGIALPLIGFGTLSNPYVGITCLLASLFVFVHFLHLNNNRFAFEENGIRLPWVDHRLLPYANLKRIYLEESPNLSLVIEYVPKSSIKRGEGEAPPVGQLFEMEHLTSQSARQLSELFFSKLSSCEISPDVHTKLLNWKSNTAETVENDKFGLIYSVTRYLKICGKVLVKAWIIGWMVVAFVAYPVGFTYIVNQNAGIQLITTIAEHSPHGVKHFLLDWLLWELRLARDWGSK